MRDFNGGDCRLLQDNAPSHVTDLIYDALAQNHINWVLIFPYKNTVFV